MDEVSDQPQPYRVVFSGLCRATYQHYLDQAKEQGRHDEIAQAGRDIQRQLELVPLDFGEPTHDLVFLGLQVRLAPCSPFAVTFCVDEPRRIVYVIRPFKLLPNSGLVPPKSPS